MPRSNRPRGSRRPDDSDPGDLSRALYGSRRTETKSDGIWNVQPVSPTNAAKTYTCPGCSQQISIGVAHTVAWRADGIMGEVDDIAGRRHWHQHCWKIRL
ncbi:hypothetical protein [Salinibacterium sp. M195]|uniref:hypothetical protein n=1 Tax=Salinibacterium sp. M195 TaxID=2583374 RepID=UPI001C633489|nr:hypothetical protein [Salinibacterium sp. M195]QYH35774.1 hypothetical protein FFT87_07290 [Salinibacterium sp. M195]